MTPILIIELLQVSEPESHKYEIVDSEQVIKQIFKGATPGFQKKSDRICLFFAQNERTRNELLPSENCFVIAPGRYKFKGNILSTEIENAQMAGFLPDHAIDKLAALVNTPNPLDVDTYISSLESVKTMGFPPAPSFSDWYAKWGVHRFKTKLQLYQRLRSDLRHVVAYMDGDFLLNEHGLVKIVHDLDISFQINKKSVSLAELLTNCKNKFLSRCTKICSFVTPPKDAGVFNIFKSPIKVLPQPSIKDITIFKLFIREVLAANDTATETKIYDFIRGILTNMPIRQALYLFSDTQGVGKHTLCYLIKNMIYMTRYHQIGLNEITKTPFHHSALLCVDHLLGTKSDWEYLQHLISAPEIKQDKIPIENLINIIIMGNKSNSLTLPPTDRRFNCIHVARTKLNDVPFFTKLYASINDPEQLSNFAYFVLNRPIGQIEVLDTSLRKSLIEMSPTQRFIKDRPITTKKQAVVLDTLFARYKEWAIVNEELPVISKTDFCKELMRLGYQKSTSYPWVITIDFTFP
nr:hypothetical protein [Abalone asfa-like virus]